MAIENELPPSAAPALETARLTIAAMQRQVQECEDHNTELLTIVAAVRQWAATTHRAAINRLAQGTPDPRYWQSQLDAAQAVSALLRSAE